MNSEEFFPIENILKRDKQIIEHDLYQIQANKDDNKCDFKYLGKYDNIPMIPIFDKQINGYNCSLVSFVITKEDIRENNDLNMIGFLISKNNNIGACLMLTFIPEKKTEIENLDNIVGKFEINLMKKLLGKVIKENIKTYDKYMGKDESIYILTELLLDVI